MPQDRLAEHKQRSNRLSKEELMGDSPFVSSFIIQASASRYHWEGGCFAAAPVLAFLKGLRSA